MKKNRRRSLRAAEPTSAMPVPAAPVEVRERPALAKSRRRSRRSETTSARADDAARSPDQPAVGALSGQLPPGTARAAGVIATEAGRYLRQAARDEAPSRYGSPAGAVDDSARRVWEIAFGLAVRRRFEPGAPLAEIGRTVATAVHDHAAAAIPTLDAEMLVRAALGEVVPVGDIDEGVRIAVHLLLFASLADELALGDAELDQLIGSGEEEAAAFAGG
ncbi:hypothetical protein ACFQS1_16410 [Paractinoplanes rhizophilus]|uniref:Uncharacterized protein n=1 Tax=Paractinoplanes rhizophilus TaxID=1416877 RepID=A0ABW2HR35_9ACTN|nr:hypothetical protein [Actinoplanes sp.]